MTAANFGELEEQAVQHAVYDILSTYITSPDKVTSVTATDVNSIDISFYLEIDHPADVADSQLALVDGIYGILNSNLEELKKQLEYWMNEFGADESLSNVKDDFFPLSAGEHYFSNSNTKPPTLKPTIPTPSSLPTDSTGDDEPTRDDVTEGGSVDDATSGNGDDIASTPTSPPVVNGGASSSKSSDDADAAATAAWVVPVVFALLLCMVVVYMYQSKLYCFKEADESMEPPVPGDGGDDIAVEADSVQPQAAALDEANLTSAIVSSNDASMVEAPASMVTDVQEKIIEADL